MIVRMFTTRVSFTVFKCLNLSSYISSICFRKKHSVSERPKQKVKLDRMNEMVESLSQGIHLMVVNIGLPGIILPKVISSFYKYIATDAGNAAFELGVASWWVPPMNELYGTWIIFLFLSCLTNRFVSFRSVNWKVSIRLGKSHRLFDRCHATMLSHFLFTTLLVMLSNCCARRLFICKFNKWIHEKRLEIIEQNGKNRIE